MNAPKLPSFFKTTSHRQFDFKTRYYNASKDERSKQLSSKSSQASTTVRFSSHWSSSKRSKAVSQSNKRWLLIALILGLVCFLFLNL